jgi:hypothetical protein
VFLDVEGTPSLSEHYFVGWATALRRHSLALTSNKVELLPCVYATTGDIPTWSALNSAVSHGTKCFGAWTAHKIDNACATGPVVFNSGLAEPKIGLPFEVLAWQYALDCGPNKALDYSQTHPLLDATTHLLPFLIAT